MSGPEPLVVHTGFATSLHKKGPSDDGNYVFTTDEVSDAYLAAYDVSDPSNIFEVDRIFEREVMVREIVPALSISTREDI